MIVSFSVNYRTNWGETIWLNITEGEGEPRLHQMNCYDGERWVLNLDIPTSTIQIEYTYEVRKDEQLMGSGWGKRRKLELDQSYQRYTLRDTWQGIPRNKHLFSSPFTETFFRRDPKASPKPHFDQAITIKIFAPAVKPNQRLYLTGNNENLGNWDISKALPMDGTHFPEWSVTIDAEIARTGDQYKFVVVENGHAVEWEQGENRFWHRSAFDPREHRVYSGLHFRGGDTHWRGAGVAIPVFSLRSKTSYGIGDFEDLRKMADWASLTEQKVIQILPINDTTQSETWRDSYPYRSISIFALHPLYLSLHPMGELKDAELSKKIKAQAKHLNSLPELDYEGVGEMKWQFFKAIYKQEGKKTLASKPYKEFYTANKDWLLPYATFCYLRDKNNTAEFGRWGKEKKYSAKLVQTIANPSFEEWDRVAIYMYLQYHLDSQLRAAAAYCHSRGDRKSVV